MGYLPKRMVIIMIYFMTDDILINICYRTNSIDIMGCCTPEHPPKSHGINHALLVYLMTYMTDDILITICYRTNSIDTMGYCPSEHSVTKIAW